MTVSQSFTKPAKWVGMVKTRTMPFIYQTFISSCIKNHLSGCKGKWDCGLLVPPFSPYYRYYKLTN